VSERNVVDPTGVILEGRGVTKNEPRDLMLTEKGWAGGQRNNCSSDPTMNVKEKVAFQN